MKLLIIEDDPGCRLMLIETVIHLAKRAGLEIEIFQTYCLDEAEQLLKHAEAVLCDGAFFTNLSDLYGYGRVRENWPFIAGHAAHRRIPFALLSGDYRSVEKARAGGHVAFSKPREAQAAINFLLGAMALREPGENPVVVEMDAANREIGEEGNGKRKRTA